MRVAGLVVVTCGPARAALDKMRFLSNRSTGELGTVLCESFAPKGWNVHCFRGSGSTFRPPAGVVVHGWETNGELLAGLRAMAAEGKVAAVVHAAALSDFEVGEVRGADGALLTAGKLPSRAGELTVRLRPAPKVIGELRTLFPKARLVGWKWEAEGDRKQVILRALRQMWEHRTDAVVMNGPAWGPGFGFSDANTSSLPLELVDKAALADRLRRWL